MKLTIHNNGPTVIVQLEAHTASEPLTEATIEAMTRSPGGWNYPKCPLYSRQIEIDIDNPNARLEIDKVIAAYRKIIVYHENLCRKAAEAVRQTF